MRHKIENYLEEIIIISSKISQISMISMDRAQLLEEVPISTTCNALISLNKLEESIKYLNRLKDELGLELIKN